jgi:tRNA(Ile)-lysidine synthase
MHADPVAAGSGELDRLAAGIAPGAAVGVAVSGGSDSTALLIIAAGWAERSGRPLRAATVDHGLRSESAAEAAGVAALCRKLRIPHETLTADGLVAKRGNLPAAARDARLALLAGWAVRHELAAVLLGHTLDDQAETVIMRLARGSGVEGLSAMQAERIWAGVRWLRPLLGIRRTALRDVLRQRRVQWVEDPTNEDSGYDRVRARAALAALAPLGIDSEGLAATAMRLQRQRRVLERAMRELAARARHWGALGEAWLDPQALAADEVDTALRLLADTLQRLSGAPYRPRYRALAGALDRLLAGPTADATLSGCVLRRRRGGPVLVCREPAACAGPVPLAGSSIDWDGRWMLVPRNGWPDGAAVAAIGRGGLDALRAAARAGTWRAPSVWGSAPAILRMSTPGIWSVTTGALLAAPLAGYAAAGVEASVDIVPVARLRDDAVADYGRLAVRCPGT